MGLVVSRILDVGDILLLSYEIDFISASIGTFPACPVDEIIMGRFGRMSMDVVWYGAVLIRMCY